MISFQIGEIQEQEAPRQHQCPTQDGSEARAGTDSCNHRGGSEAPHSGSHRPNYENEKSAQAPIPRC